jgi:hypothetical protein
MRGLVGSFGKIEAAASLTRVSVTSLHNYCSLNVEQEKTHIPVDVWIDLMQESGDLRSLSYVAGLFGKTLVDCPTGRAGAVSDKAIKAIKEMAEAIKAATGDDKQAILKEAEEAAQAAMDLVVSAKAEIEAGE